jgi:hypothetical protein
MSGFFGEKGLVGEIIATYQGERARRRRSDLCARGEAGGVVFSTTALNQLSELASEAVAVRARASSLSREGPAAIPRPRLRGTRGGRRRGGPSRAPAARSWFRVSHLNIEWGVRERGSLLYARIFVCFARFAELRNSFFGCCGKITLPPRRTSLPDYAYDVCVYK